MNIIQVKGGKIEIRKDNDSIEGTMSNGDAIATSFNTDQSQVVITIVKGKVEIRKKSGSLIRTI